MNCNVIRHDKSSYYDILLHVKCEEKERWNRPIKIKNTYLALDCLCDCQRFLVVCHVAHRRHVQNSPFQFTLNQQRHDASPISLLFISHSWNARHFSIILMMKYDSLINTWLAFDYVFAVVIDTDTEWDLFDIVYSIYLPCTMCFTQFGAFYQFIGLTRPSWSVMIQLLT